MDQTTLPTADSWYRKPSPRVQGYLSSLQRRVRSDSPFVQLSCHFITSLTFTINVCGCAATCDTFGKQKNLQVELPM